ncbi:MULTISPECIES: sugar MFS transporter [Rhodanobacter]|uniref:sugar MFS transporter n=1 Tax=Rhodanobacter TaxID=75309 RepID=UPI00041AAA42|nr:MULTISPECIES: sugar MFS transporter [Rhodanobacter]KZC19598.1 MFS transporter [Rhodanobacter denitrificans]UJJ51259.1 sugar MFS transporter [Rhodanobacter denitrificans]UJM94006.1 sugar MFS transporter [Rhodanobacter denitrificans]UJM97535.1 sugar MFS transporter [Rhodanobacter denitrificans]UJN23050.1 sugar MFS transporter [Rhodanobacter denitrificans]
MATTLAAAPSDRTHLGPMLIIGLLFFIFGFVTWLNGPLITFVKLAFQVEDVYAFLVPSAFYVSYLVFSLPASLILRRTGMKKGMALGLFVMAIGAVLFGQFVSWREFAGALTGLFVIGAGLSLLQTASNPYISILGPIDSAAQRIAFMGICNKVAGILAPLLIGTLVLNGIGDLDAKVKAADPTARELLLNEFAAKIHAPYLVMAGILALLAIWIARSSLPDIEATTANSTPVRAGAAHTGILQVPHLWLGVLCLFLYVGVEVMAGDAIGTYGASFHLPLDQTKFFTAFTLSGMLIGYVVGLLLIPRFVSQQRYLAISAVLGVLFSIGAYLSRGYVSVGFVAALGFANAMMWPAIFPLAIKGLGSLTERGSALLIMAIAGGAVVPQLFVHLKQHVDFQLAFALLMVPCYLYILYYGLAGHRVGQHMDSLRPRL